MVSMSFTACRERYSSDGCLYRESWDGKLVFFDKLIGGERIVSNSTKPSHSRLYNICQNIFVIVAEYFQDVVHVHVCTLSACF